MGDIDIAALLTGQNIGIAVIAYLAWNYREQVTSFAKKATSGVKNAVDASPKPNGRHSKTDLINAYSVLSECSRECGADTEKLDAFVIQLLGNHTQTGA